MSTPTLKPSLLSNTILLFSGASLQRATDTTRRVHQLLVFCPLRNNQIHRASTRMAHGSSPITESDHASLVSIITAIFMAYMLLCYITRVLLRLTINGPLGLDDWLVGAGSVS